MPHPRAPRGQPRPFPQRDAAGRIIRWAINVALPPGPDGGRRQRRLYGRTEAEAVRRAAELRRLLDQGHQGAPERETVRDYLERWYADEIAGAKAERTDEGYRSILDRHLLPALGGLRLDRLGPEPIQRLYNDRRRAGYSPTTIRHWHAVLRQALGQAVRHGRLPRNPALAVTVPKQPKSPGKSLTPEQAQALVAAARGERLEALFVLVLSTGLRASEAFGLRWADVDLERGRLAVEQTGSRRRRREPFAGTKSHRSTRPVPLIPLAVAALKVHRVRQNEERLAAGPDWEDHGLVFTTRRGTLLDDSNVTPRDWTRLLAKIGLVATDPTTGRRERLLRFHDLRHTAGTFLLAQGVPLKVVSEILGHASIGITADLYGHVLDQSLDDAAAALDRLLGVPKTESGGY